VAGLTMLCNNQTTALIPALWSEFTPWIGSVPGQQGSTTYGVCIPQGDGTIQYLAGVEVTADAPLPKELMSVVVPEGRYALFTHESSLDLLQDTLSYIFGTWNQQTSSILAGQPYFERYDERFDPTTSTGAMEYWVPVKST